MILFGGPPLVFVTAVKGGRKAVPCFKRSSKKCLQGRTTTVSWPVAVLERGCEPCYFQTTPRGTRRNLSRREGACLGSSSSSVRQLLTPEQDRGSPWKLRLQSTPKRGKLTPRAESWWTQCPLHYWPWSRRPASPYSCRACLS